MVYKELVQKIIDILKAATGLAEPDDIAKYYFGRPVRFDVYPLIYVEWLGGPVEEGTITKHNDINRFHAAVITKDADAEAAAKFVMDKYELMRQALKDNASLDNLVDDSSVTNKEAESIIEGDYAVSGVRLTLTTRSMIS